MSIPTKTFTLLSNVPTGNGPGRIPIGQCSEIMENKCQCWRAAADYLVTVVYPIDETAEGVKLVQRVDTYQKCRRHAQIEKEEYDKEVAAQAAAETSLS